MAVKAGTAAPSVRPLLLGTSTPVLSTPVCVWRGDGGAMANVSKDYSCSLCTFCFYAGVQNGK